MSTYKTLNEIIIDSSALVHNYHYFQTINPQAQVCPVIKANAYGHGLIEIAKIIDKKISAPYLMVDSLYEAYELQKNNIKTPIMIMGYTDPQNYSVWKKLPFTFTVYDTQSLLALNKYQKGAKVHIKLDTGMCRLGIQKEKLNEFISVLKTCNNLQVEGIYSHLSQADDPKKLTFTNNQIKLFKEMVTIFKKSDFNFKYKHIAATSGASIPHDPYFNLIRLGLGLYGYSPFGPHTNEGRDQRQNLRPTLTFTSKIALIKTILPGNQVGYGGTYIAKQEELIAILTAGYNEGISRGLGNKLSFSINNIQCPIVGNVSMDMTTIKIPRTVNAKIGDTVTIISPDINSSCSVYKMSSILKTIPYTVLTNLHPSTKRTIL